MSSDAPTVPTLDADVHLQAALLWDVPRLRRSGARGAEAFIDAFGAHGASTTDAVGLPESPLELAAMGVVSDRSGAAEQALEAYGRVSGSYWADLLRHSLRGWSVHVQGVDDIRVAGDLVKRLPSPSPVRSLLSVKLATFAYDKGDRSLVETLLREAIAASPERSRLRIMLAMESANILREIVEAPHRLSDVPPDPLVDRDWIDAWALAGAQVFLSESLEDVARNPWSSTLRIGRTPLNQVVAAELQVTWAGALWQRRPIRKQLGAQLLLAEPRTASQAAQGLFHWFTAGGQQFASVVDLAEPSLDQAACDWLIHALASRVGPNDVVSHTLAQVAAQLWDCVSEPLVGSLLDASPVEAGDHPVIADNRRVWVRLADRSPDEISRRLPDLPQDAVAALVDELDYGALERLDDLARGRLIRLLHEIPDLTEGQWLSLSVLERASTDEDLPAFRLEDAPAALVVRLAELDRERVEDRSLLSALTRLAEEVRHQRRRAREGVLEFGGGPSSARLLADGLIAYGAESAELTSALWESALDEALAGEPRLQALAALGRLGSVGMLVPDRRDDLRVADTHGDERGLLSVSGDLLRAARLLVLAGTLRPHEEFELLALARSRDVRARELAVNAAGLSLDAHPRRAGPPTIGQVVLTALFDPNESVVVRGLDVIGAGHLPAREADDALGRRLLELMETRRRSARAATVRTARVLVDRDRVRAAGATVLDLAKRDKSWRVREALVRAD